jgi:hypothetical protein
MMATGMGSCALPDGRRRRRRRRRNRVHVHEGRPGDGFLPLLTAVILRLW